MKTPQEFLLEKHRTASPKLDVIRERTIARLAKPPEQIWSRVAGSFSWQESIFSLRWHLAGMSASWLVIAALNLNVGRPTGLVATTIPRAKIPSAQIILASLRENRRELLEMIQSSEAHDARPVKLSPSQPRSERHYEILTG